MYSAFLLAAGFGTRLRPLSLARPKPLLPMGGVPMLDHALAQVRAHGHESVMVNAHHLWQQVATWAEARNVGLQVELPEILGTGGGLKAAEAHLAGHFVVVNADILCDVDLRGLVAVMPEGGAAMALRHDPLADQIGPVEADEAGRVVRITSVVQAGDGLPGTHFTGVHAMARSALKMVPAEGEQCVVRTAYKALVLERRVGALVHDGTWIDVGTPEAYLAANLDLLAGRIKAPVDLWSHGRPGPDGSWFGPGARVEGRVCRALVGAGAVVPAGVTLEDSVLWDGIEAPLGTHRFSVIYGPTARPGESVLGQVLEIGEAVCVST